MKRKLVIITIFVLMVALVGCGKSGGSGGGGNAQDEAKLPEGLYMLAYYCNENGEYVAGSNETTDYDGYPTTELEQLYNEKVTFWCDIAADGTGKLEEGNFQTTAEISFDPEEGYIWLDSSGNSIFYNYHYDAEKDAFWYGDGDYCYYMRSCTQDEIDDVYAGRGGSVAISKAEVGDLVCLGNYDTWPYNEETEPLFWRVIDKQDGKLLILCDKLIDSFCYNTNPDMTDLDKVTWENCSVRKFLNNDFLEQMFTEEERALIQTTHLENKQANDKLLEQWGSWEDRDGIPYSEQTEQTRGDDPDTDDKVFLLSYQEVLKYFGEPTEEYTGDGGYPFTEMQANSNWKALITKTVQYNAIGYFDIDTCYGAWMTRTLSGARNEPGALVTYITSEGQVFNYYTYTPMFIRPAMWIAVG